MDNVVNKAEGEWQLTVHHTVCSVTQSIGPLRHGTGPLGLESGFKGEESWMFQKQLLTKF